MPKTTQGLTPAFSELTVFLVSMITASAPPFSKEWLDGWGKLAEKRRSRKVWDSFLKKNGTATLEKLAKKRANQNLILALFLYLWDERKPKYDRLLNDRRLDTLRSIWRTRSVYRWRSKDDEIRREMVSASLARLQEQLARELLEEDYKFDTNSFQSDKNKRSPEDKVNRVIFIIFEHLKDATGGP